MKCFEELPFKMKEALHLQTFWQNSEWLLWMANERFFSYIMARTSYIQWNDDDDVCFVLDQHA